MNTITETIHEYVSLRRGLGFKLHDDERELLQFAAFLETRRAPCITQELAVEWARQPQNVLPSRWAKRLTYVRGFARYRQGIDPRTEVPAPELLPWTSARRKPYLFSDQQVQALLQAAHKLPYHFERGALRPQLYYCLIGLLSVTGLRSGEARIPTTTPLGWQNDFGPSVFVKPGKSTRHQRCETGFPSVAKPDRSA